MSQGFVVPGSVTVTKVSKSQPLTTEKINDRYSKGVFNHVKVNEKKKGSTSKLAANFEACQKHIAKNVSTYPAESSLSVFCYDVRSMTAGTIEEIFNYVNDHAPATYNRTYLNYGYFGVFNRFWLTADYSEFAAPEDIVNLASQMQIPIDLEYVQQMLTSYAEFFQAQKAIKLAHKGLHKAPKKLNFEQLSAELGILTDRHVIKAIAKWIKTNPGESSSNRKPSTRKAGSVARYFVPARPGEHIYIALSGQGKLQATSKAESSRSASKVMFNSFPHTHLKDLNTAEAVINTLLAHQGMTEDYLKSVTDPRFKVLDTDSIDDRARKFGEFINHLRQELNEYRYRAQSQTAIAPNLAYNQGLQQQFAQPAFNAGQVFGRPPQQ